MKKGIGLFFLVACCICFTLYPIYANSNDLPEFFGNYLKSKDGTITEIPQSDVGITGWFVKKKAPKSNDMNAMSQYISSGGDASSAFNAHLNKKIFVSSLSGLQMSSNELNGFIVYGENDVNDIKIVKLSNKLIPSNATFASYEGPKPINRKNMWLPYQSYEFQMKPLKDNMYYLKTREKLSCGRYAIKNGNQFSEFQIMSSVGQLNKQDLIGDWISKTYANRKDGTVKKIPFLVTEMKINDVDANGYIVGSYVVKGATGKSKGKVREKGNYIQGKGGWQFDLEKKTLTSVDEDKGDPNAIYGISKGKIVMLGDDCEYEKIIIRGAWTPYNKFHSTQLCKEYDIFWEIAKKGELL